jgi:hypothetical protein
MIYTHVAEIGAAGTKSPLDTLLEEQQGSCSAPEQREGGRGLSQRCVNFLISLKRAGSSVLPELPPSGHVTEHRLPPVAHA